MKLSEKQCIPCKGGVQPFTKDQAEKLLSNINSDWQVIDDSTKLKRIFKYKNFNTPMKFAVIIGEIADKENHHPDLKISWGKLGVIITTHAIKGLAESDFIFAAKVDVAFESFQEQQQ
jgi:4a-hydroxytetrahydrobiopterin dehydratase